MFVSYRHVLAVAAASISFVALMTAIRITQALPHIQGGRIQTANVVDIPYEPLETDPSFFEPAAPVHAAEAPVRSAPENKPVVAPDPVSARAYIVGDVETGAIYLERNGNAVLPVASMSKLVTAFVAINELKDDQLITVADDAKDLPPDKSGIGPGETYTMRELLYPLLLSSSNVAAEALASASSRQKFLESMSAYAWEIGMGSSFFADPSGVSPKNEASARDLFALARYLYSSRPDILELTRSQVPGIASTTQHAAHEFPSTHPFIADKRFLGGKTGRTPEAGDTMMTILNLAGRKIAIVVLGSKYEGRAQDTSYLAQKVEAMIGAGQI